LSNPFFVWSCTYDLTASKHQMDVCFRSSLSLTTHARTLSSAESVVARHTPVYSERIWVIFPYMPPPTTPICCCLQDLSRGSLLLPVHCRNLIYAFTTPLILPRLSCTSTSLPDGSSTTPCSSLPQHHCAGVLAILGKVIDWLLAFQ